MKSLQADGQIDGQQMIRKAHLSFQLRWAKIVWRFLFTWVQLKYISIHFTVGIVNLIKYNLFTPRNLIKNQTSCPEEIRRRGRERMYCGSAFRLWFRILLSYLLLPTGPSSKTQSYGKTCNIYVRKLSIKNKTVYFFSNEDKSLFKKSYELVFKKRRSGFDPQSQQTWVVKTDSDSSTAKRSATGVLRVLGGDHYKR